MKDLWPDAFARIHNRRNSDRRVRRIGGATSLVFLSSRACRRWPAVNLGKADVIVPYPTIDRSAGTLFRPGRPRLTLLPTYGSRVLPSQRDRTIGKFRDNIVIA
jgi:hypothetical protein